LPLLFVLFRLLLLAALMLPRLLLLSQRQRLETEA
jgi:hypothetical protein